MGEEPNLYIQLIIPAIADKIYLDELIMATNQFTDPQIFVDHYNHNVPWGAEYIP